MNDSPRSRLWHYRANDKMMEIMELSRYFVCFVCYAAVTELGNRKVALRKELDAPLPIYIPPSPLLPFFFSLPLSLSHRQQRQSNSGLKKLFETLVAQLLDQHIQIDIDTMDLSEIVSPTAF